MKIYKYTLLLAFLLVLASCSSENGVHKTLPSGNLNLVFPESKLNDSLNQISISAIPLGLGNSAIAYEREVKNASIRTQRLINSRDFIRNIIQPSEDNEEVIEALTKNLEQISLITDSSGYVSFSQPISDIYAKYKDLNISGNVGGTDIFKFDKIKGEYNFKALPEPINSVFWDSHPCVVRDTVKNGKIITLLVWASDRESPFVRNLIGNLAASPNTDINLYYAFLDGDKILKFDSFNGINSKADEISPFIYCICSKPKLFFASNRNSESNFQKKDNFDLYYSELEVNFHNLQIKVLQAPKLISGYEEGLNVLSTINSSIFNEIFPYAPNPIGIGTREEYLYFSSDRFSVPWSKIKKKFINLEEKKECPCERTTSDSVIASEGGYDFYVFEMPQHLRCIPPPKPALRMIAEVNLISLNAENDTLSIEELYQQDINIAKISKNMADKIQELYKRKASLEENKKELEINPRKNQALLKKCDDELQSIDLEKYELFNQISSSNILYAKSNQYYEISENSAYLISIEKPDEECFHINCSELVLISPEQIFKDDTLTVVLNCVSKPLIANQVKFEYAKGLAFFVTGYWRPTTIENLRFLEERMYEGCLEYSKFINLFDYDYQAAAELNSNFLKNEFYPKIDSVLNLLDQCNSRQTLRIVVYGLTDPCRLRPTPNEEQTLYTCDPDIEYYEHSSERKTIIKAGTMMKAPDLVDESGKPFPMPYGVQQGNYLLSMLRSYYTMETIDKGLKEYSNRYRELRSRKEIYDIFELKAVGIDKLNSECPGVWHNFVRDKNFKNTPIVPINCDNQPFSRRVIIYADIIEKSDINKGFTVSPCGARQNKTIAVEKEEFVLPSMPVETVDLERKDLEDDEMGCPGPPCYFWIEFANVESEEEANFVESMLKLAGIEDYILDRSRKPYIRIVSRKDESKEYVEEKLAEYQKLLKNKLDPLVDEVLLKMSIKF
ncbi:MAG: hypothetical protein GX121_00305 [Ignavibacteria bacterium]|nr:hypothetical protein [Ignavibacteria bacterium]